MLQQFAALRNTCLNLTINPNTDRTVALCQPNRSRSFFVHRALQVLNSYLGLSSVIDCTSIVSMAPLALTVREAADAMEKGAPDLQFLMAHQEVPDAVQAMFYHSGVTTIGKFATAAVSAEDMRRMLKDDFGVDATLGMAHRDNVASVLMAHEVALARMDEEARFEGEKNTKQLHRPLPPSEWSAMKKAWEAKWWHLEDSQVPGRSYLEKRANELEGGDMRAEQLTTILSQDEDQTECLTSFGDNAGQLQLRKGGTTVSEPTNPQQLRKRIELMGVALMMLGLRHSDEAGLQGITPQDMEDYLSYLLGEFVWQLTDKAAGCSTVSTPLWSQLILYEYNIRKNELAI